MVEINRNMCSKFYSGFIPIYGYFVTEGFRCRVSGVSLAAGQKKASLIEEETEVSLKDRWGSAFWVQRFKGFGLRPLGYDQTSRVLGSTNWLTTHAGD